jgi:transposase-like protein
MHEDTPGTPVPSMLSYEHLEALSRVRVQQFIQAVLDEELTALLGRQRSQRRRAVDAPKVYRNGHGRPRKLAMTGGTITLRRPRVRGLEQRFASRVLPLFVRRTREVGALLPELYLHGLAQGDFELALRGLLGDAAPLSSASIARLRAKWQAEYEAWNRRPLDDREVVYVWADGLYVKAGLEQEKAALLVVIGVRRDGRKELLALTPGYRESTASWLTVLRSLRDRGLNAPRLLVADGALGIWAAAEQVWPETPGQRCWNHKLINVLDQLPKKTQPEARHLLTAIPYAESRAAALAARDVFARKYETAYPKALAALDRDWERATAFYDFPREHWKHLRTTNIVESPFATVRLRTAAAKRFKKVASATALIWRVLRVAESRFRRLDAPELLALVHEGRRFEDGNPVPQQPQLRTAA